MVLRMAAGDLNAWIGLIGFVAGVAIGTVFISKGFSLGRTYNLNQVEGSILPIFQIVLLAMVASSSALLVFSEKGPGSMHAPIVLSLVLALVVGALAQRSRICQAGGFRDLFMLKDMHLLWGNVAIVVVGMIYSLIVNKFNLSLYHQPVAHSQWLWNILGLLIVGFGSVLLGGCPMRQLVLTGTGNVDSAITVIGFVVGAAFCHNLGLASGADAYEEGTNIVTGGGTTPNGRIATIICIVLLFIIAAVYTKKQKKTVGR